MKFIPTPELAKIAAVLDGFIIGERKLHARIEAYSCKNTRDGKRESEAIESKLPEDSSCDTGTIVKLISLLNESFPDYDFSECTPDQFPQIHHIDQVTSEINAMLESVEKIDSGFKKQFWKNIDSVISLAHCELYSYQPVTEDIIARGHGFAYFFFNKKLKKIVFFLCNSIPRRVEMMEDEDDEEVDVDDANDDDVELEDDDSNKVSTMAVPSPGTLAAVANLSVGMSPLRLAVPKKDSSIEVLHLGGSAIKETAQTRRSIITNN